MQLGYWFDEVGDEYNGWELENTDWESKVFVVFTEEGLRLFRNADGSWNNRLLHDWIVGDMYEDAEGNEWENMDGHIQYNGWVSWQMLNDSAKREQLVMMVALYGKE